MQTFYLLCGENSHHIDFHTIKLMKFMTHDGGACSHGMLGLIPFVVSKIRVVFLSFVLKDKSLWKENTT